MKRMNSIMMYTVYTKVKVEHKQSIGMSVRIEIKERNYEN